jgi:hypothetical protein
MNGVEATPQDKSNRKPSGFAGNATAVRGPLPGKWAFLFAFIFSCFLFWWLRSILLRFVFQFDDSVEDGTIAISILALLSFSAGYLFPIFRRPVQRSSRVMLDACEEFAYKATLALFFPSLLVAIVLLRSHMTSDYGSADPTPTIDQAILYTHLFFGFMFIGAADPGREGYRRIWIAGLLLTLPRLIVSLHGARFFLAQALVPVLLIALARGWVRITARRMLQLAALVCFIIFVPAITRGDALLGPDRELQMFMGSDVLGLFQKNTDISLNDRCPPLFISLTAKTIPYNLLGACVIDIGGMKNLPATLERILTDNDPGSFHGTISGTGSNYLLELYVTGGLFAVYAGSALFGFSCRRFMEWTGARSLFSGVWAECLTRSLLAPRGNLGYVYERIPSLLIATAFVVLLVAAERLLRREYQPASRMAAAVGDQP